MLAIGCGCLAVHFVTGKFHGTVQLMLAERWTHQEILSGTSTSSIFSIICKGPLKQGNFPRSFLHNFVMTRVA